MNSGQFALIKKDIRGITSNKQIFAVLLIVPLVLTIVLLVLCQEKVQIKNDFFHLASTLPGKLLLQL